jgi:hypothetical protein
MSDDIHFDDLDPRIVASLFRVSAMLEWIAQMRPLTPQTFTVVLQNAIVRNPEITPQERAYIRYLCSLAPGVTSPAPTPSAHPGAAVEAGATRPAPGRRR